MRADFNELEDKSDHLGHWTEDDHEPSWRGTDPKTLRWDLTCLQLHSLALFRHGRDSTALQPMEKNSMKKNVTVEEWVAMYREIGLDEARMMQWHRIFEARHPEAHQGFLEWLGLPAKEIERIRSKSK
jgi:hypothetical protein